MGNTVAPRLQDGEGGLHRSSLELGAQSVTQLR